MRVPLLPILFSAAILASGCDRLKGSSRPKTAFDAQAAMSYTKQTLDFGPRVPGTPAHDKTDFEIGLRHKLPRPPTGSSPS